MSDAKDTNPKDLVGSRKAPLSTLPFRVLWRVGLAMLEGMCKYGRHNYRIAGARASVYFDAVVGRHLGGWWEGEDIDPDSGFNHIDKAIAGLMVLRDSMLQGNWVDDRPPSGKEDMGLLNAEAARIVDLHKDKRPHHWTIKDQVGDFEPVKGEGAWTPWFGRGKPPLSDDTIVEVERADEMLARGMAPVKEWDWSWCTPDPKAGDIVRYRVVFP